MSDELAGLGPFLHDADSRLLQVAVASNHRELFILRTRIAHGEICEADGVTWTDPNQDRGPLILFPQLVPERAGEQLDTIIQFYRERQPQPLVGCWSLDPPSPPDLDVRLLARGFQPGWRPCWMWLDLQSLRMDHPQPDGLRIEVLETAPTWEAPQLPYFDRAEAAIDRTIAARHPRQLWHFVASLAGEVVGHSMLFVTSGPLGVAGIYNVGVVPDARNRGVGKVVTMAACRHAQTLGCRHALLNATGERMYRQLGFERIGYGWTWWLNVARLEARPPTSETIAVAEAVGRGDVDALAALAQRGAVELLDEPLANGMSLLELSAHARQLSSAEWLVGQGAALDVVVAWDLGWRGRAAQLIAEHPARANRQRGEMATTPLHEAVQRDDHELAQVLLAARADVSIKDATFGATPLEWARHMQRTKMVELIEGYLAKR
ncbi:MAG: GNAT family N-acetyltransferase [Chloroflexales bacterium]|nr:GNAT family N-acetyltransferase [Chloroflexales bacterium]